MSSKSSNSSGYDEVLTKLLKLFSHFISSPLNYICNMTLFMSVFRCRLKYAIIRPLFKKGNKNFVLLQANINFNLFSKIFEKVMQTRLLNHMTDHNILNKKQYGIRTKQKTDNATYQLTNKILNALNNNLLIGSIFCNLEKAFDCVNHKILLSKLEFFGITSNHYKLYFSLKNKRPT